jgi:hypothetical protein
MKKKNVVVVLAGVLLTPQVWGQELEEGLKAYKKNNDVKAKKIFRTLLSENKKEHVARFNLASIYLYEKNYKLALRHYSIVGKSDSKLKLAALYFMAECYFYLREDGKAAKILSNLKKKKLPSSLRNNVKELYSDLNLKTPLSKKDKNGGDKYEMWGAGELALGYSDNLNLDSELDTTKVGGVELEGDFILGMDIYANNNVTVTPSVNYYFSNEQKTGGYSSSGTIAQLRLKNKLSKVRSVILKAGIENINTYDSPYLSKMNFQVGQVHSYKESRVSYYYKYQSISEEIVSANYLAGSAHFLGSSYSRYGEIVTTRLGLSYTSKNLNDSATTASSYTGVRPSLSLTFKGSNQKKFTVSAGVNIKSYKKKDSGEKEKRKDTLLTLDLESSKNIGKYVEIFAAYGYGKNTSNYKSALNNKEYSANSIKVGFNVEF